MNICFIGLGSIAKRHIRNLQEIFGNKVAIDVLRTTKNNIGDFTYDNINIIYDEIDLKNKYDAIFITNPTSLHYDTLIKYNNKSECFFIEKPIFMFGDEDTSIFKNNKIYYTACPLRYSNVIQYLKKKHRFLKSIFYKEYFVKLFAGMEIWR